MAQGTHRGSALHMARNVADAGEMNHFKDVCRTMQRKRQGQRSLQGRKTVHEFQKDKKCCMME